MTRRTFEADTLLQALIVEHALALARQLEQTADGAPDGQVLARVEAAAVPAGRELTRRAVDTTLGLYASARSRRQVRWRR